MARVLKVRRVQIEAHPRSRKGLPENVHTRATIGGVTYMCLFVVVRSLERVTGPQEKKGQEEKERDYKEEIHLISLWFVIYM